VIDYFYYQKWLLAVVNIARYNAPKEGDGGELYGVEPWTFYLFNLLLNFNVAFLLALFAPFCFLFTYARKYIFHAWKVFGPLFLWLLIMWSMPHKEERFLIVVYPHLCLAASITLDFIGNWKSDKKRESLVPTVRKTEKQNKSGITETRQRKKGKPEVRAPEASSTSSSFDSLTTTIFHYLPYLLLSVFILLSLSRAFALILHFRAPFLIYKDMYYHVSSNQPTQVPHTYTAQSSLVSVCVGKEWYRFPSHFFLPNTIQLSPSKPTSPLRLEFLKSHFTGQLPKHFGVWPNGTFLIQTHFNDRNREDGNQYVSLSDCTYLIDLELEDQIESYYSNHTNFKVLKRYPFLDASHSRFPWRSWYIPIFSEKKNKYGSYVLLQSKTH